MTNLFTDVTNSNPNPFPEPMRRGDYRLYSYNDGLFVASSVPHNGFIFSDCDTVTTIYQVADGLVKYSDLHRVWSVGDAHERCMAEYTRKPL